MSVSKPFLFLSVLVIAVLLMTGVAWLGLSSGVPVANAAPRRPTVAPTQTPIIIIIVCDPSGCTQLLQAPPALLSTLHNAPGVRVAPASIPSLLGTPSPHPMPVVTAALNAR